MSIDVQREHFSSEHERGIHVQNARDAGFKVEYMPSQPPDYRAAIVRMYHILRGTQVALSNGMIPERQREAVKDGCINGLVEYLGTEFNVIESQVAVILQAVELQRAVAAR